MSYPEHIRLPYPLPYIDFTAIEAKRRGLPWWKYIRAHIALGELNVTVTLESVTTPPSPRMEH